MADEVVERWNGIWQGHDVHFKRVFSGHRFTDAECEELCQGKTLTMCGLVGKSGKPYDAYIALAENEFNGNKYIGPKIIDFIASVPRSFCQHTFTDDERDELEAGCTIWVEGMVGKSGKPFDAHVSWGEKDDGSMGIILSFD